MRRYSPHRIMRRRRESCLPKTEMSLIKIRGYDIGEILRSLKTKDGRRDFFSRHKQLILYFIFGVGTTVISMGTYYLFRVIFPDAESVPVWLSWIFMITSGLGIESNTALPVILSWILANTFAFITNRVYVFDSTAHTAGSIFVEALKFFASRFATLIVDLIIMFLLVDLTGIHNVLYEFAAKVFSNVVVLILNFVLSKLFVFRRKESGKDISQ